MKPAFSVKLVAVLFIVAVTAVTASAVALSQPKLTASVAACSYYPGRVISSERSGTGYLTMAWIPEMHDNGSIGTVVQIHSPTQYSPNSAIPIGVDFGAGAYSFVVGCDR